jgi:hypothetical protein
MPILWQARHMRRIFVLSNNKDRDQVPVVVLLINGTNNSTTTEKALTSLHMTSGAIFESLKLRRSVTLRWSWAITKTG